MKNLLSLKPGEGELFAVCVVLICLSFLLTPGHGEVWRSTSQGTTTLYCANRSLPSFGSQRSRRSVLMRSRMMGGGRAIESRSLYPNRRRTVKGG